MKRLLPVASVRRLMGLQSSGRHQEESGPITDTSEIEKSFILAAGASRFHLAFCFVRSVAVSHNLVHTCPKQVDSLPSFPQAS